LFSHNKLAPITGHQPNELVDNPCERMREIEFVMAYLNIDKVIIIASAFVDDGHTSPIIFLKKNSHIMEQMQIEHQTWSNLSLYIYIDI
jgi:uncharacterized protein YpiB (UPF0302 family)